MNEQNLSELGLAGSSLPKSEQPLRELLTELWQNGEKLVRSDVALARAELEVKSTELKARAVAATVGGALLLTALACVAVALALLLSRAMDAWLATLIVGAAFGIVGIVLVMHKPRTEKGDTSLTASSLSARRAHVVHGDQT